MQYKHTRLTIAIVSSGRPCVFASSQVMPHVLHFLQRFLRRIVIVRTELIQICEWSGHYITRPFIAVIVHIKDQI